MINVMIADDHAIVREGLKRIFANEPDMSVSAEADSGDEVFKKFKVENWDVLILDMAMPGRNSLELIKQIHFYYPKKPILVFSMYPEDQYAIRMIRVGASGYLSKESEPSQLVAVIRQLAQGQRYVSHEISEQLIEQIMNPEVQPSHTKLTNREFQVFQAICKGLRLTDIATEMSLSAKTVTTYRSRIIKKLALKTNSDIIHYAFRNQLLD